MSKQDKAAAIKYLPGDYAPFLISKGKGEMAEKIKKLARENGVPLVEDQELLEELIVLDPGSYIPGEIFEVVAEILSFVYAQENG